MELLKRKEYKYYVSFDALDRLRERFLTSMVHDKHCRECEDSCYTVRSIYLDTRGLLFFYEKLEGLKIRKKLRIRTYNHNEADIPAFLEIKRKYKNTIYKERVIVPLVEMTNLLNGAEMRLAGEPPTFLERATLNKFIYLTKRLKLEPQVLVTYEREALIGLDDPSLRVTLDLNVRSYPTPTPDEMFREQDLCTLVDSAFILEVKFYGRMPIWVRNVIRDFRLHKQPISKYCSGLDIWLPLDDVRGVEAV